MTNQRKQLENVLGHHIEICSDEEVAAIQGAIPTDPTTGPAAWKPSGPTQTTTTMV